MVEYLRDLALRQINPSGRLFDRGGDKVLLEGGKGNRAAGLERKNFDNLGAATLQDLSGLEA
jgi:hypothetical protein